MTVWLDGALMPGETARIAPNDRGFLLGDGLFETLLAEGGEVRFLAAHLARLRHGAEVLGLNVPYDNRSLEAAMRELLASNGLSETPRASLRLTLTRGPGPRGIVPPAETAPTCLITAAKAGPQPASLSAMIATSTRRNQASPTSRLKTLGYLDAVLARQEAARAGVDEAILLNTVDRVACGSVANLFLLKGTRLITPPLSDGVLDGITRACVLEIGKELGLDTAEESLTVDDLASAEALILTNALQGLVPISRLDGRAFARSATVTALQEAYGRFAGSSGASQSRTQAR